MLGGGKILAIVVIYNGLHWIDRCLSSLSNSTIPVDIIVIDNGSTDGTQNRIKAYCPQVIFYQSPRNLGFGKANNIGMLYAYLLEYDYVYLLNQDAWVYSDTIEKLVLASENNREYGILSPLQIQANEKHFDYWFGMGAFGKPGNTCSVEDYLASINTDKVLVVDDILAANWLITKDCLNLVGCFSPTFPHYGEDNNYAMRVHHWDLKIGVVPSCRAVHDTEFRQRTKAKEMHEVYIGGLLNLSSGTSGFNVKLRSTIHWAFMAFRKYKSFAPLKNLCKTLFDLNNIRHNCHVSLNEKGAFLI